MIRNRAREEVSTEGRSCGQALFTIIAPNQVAKRARHINHECLVVVPVYIETAGSRICKFPQILGLEAKSGPSIHDIISIDWEIQIKVKIDNRVRSDVEWLNWHKIHVKTTFELKEQHLLAERR